jgi:hypothetical protein
MKKDLVRQEEYDQKIWGALYITMRDVFCIPVQAATRTLNRYPPKIIIETMRRQNAQWVAKKVEALV